MKARMIAMVAVILLAATFTAARAQESLYLRLSSETPVPGDLIILTGYGFCGSPGCPLVTIMRDDEWLGDVQVGANGRFTSTFFAQGRGWVRITATQDTSDGHRAEVDQFVAVSDDFEPQQQQSGQQPAQRPGVRAALEQPADPAAAKPDVPVGSQQGTAGTIPAVAVVLALGALAALVQRRRRA